MGQGTLETQEIFLSGLRVVVRSSCSSTSRYIARHWRAATTPMLPVEEQCELEVVADATPRIVIDGEVVWSDGERGDLAAGFEHWLYRVALARHQHQWAVFHAAALVSDDATFVFSGPSGAGKSSLALAAVRRGWKYFSDEFVVTDGRRIWGWPRAIRFDPPEPGASPPDYFAGLERDHEAVESEGAPAPRYFTVDDETVQRTPCAATQVRFVSIERAAKTTLCRVSSSIGLKYWTEAAFSEPAVSLGSLVGGRRASRASWRDPDELLDLVSSS